MQAYFDSQDADLEYDSYVSLSTPRAEPWIEASTHKSARRHIFELLGLALVFCVAILFVTDQLVSADLTVKDDEPDREITTPYFVIEIPPQILVKPEKKPEPPKPKKEKIVKERLRSIPDQQIERRRETPELNNRVSQEQKQDRTISDKTNKRAMPAVATPIIETSTETEERSVSEEALAYTTTAAYADTIGAPTMRSGDEITNRSVPDDDPSRINLDPYHYQMVNVCMRLCLTSIFTLSGMSEQQAANSSTWLRINRGENATFQYLAGRRWLEFRVFADEISDISNINFVAIPSGNMSSTEINEMLEDVTAQLCRLLGYSDCLSQLEH